MKTFLQSPYFASMFSGSWRETNEKFINVEIVDPKITLECKNLPSVSFLKGYMRKFCKFLSFLIIFLTVLEEIELKMLKTFILHNNNAKMLLTNK